MRCLLISVLIIKRGLTIEYTYYTIFSHGTFYSTHLKCVGKGIIDWFSITVSVSRNTICRKWKYIADAELGMLI